MIGFLARRFIQNYQNTADAAVRRAYGVLCGAVGIAINLLLFALKLLAGTLAGSVAALAAHHRARSGQGKNASALNDALAARRTEITDGTHLFFHLISSRKANL